MKFQKVTTGYAIRIMRDQDVLEVLPKFCKDKNISSASLTGLGAVKFTKCGYYDLKKKEYILTEYTDLIELINMTGNVSMFDGKPMLHIHATFSDHTNNAFGGHVTSLVAGITIEIHLIDHGVVSERSLDEFSGLNLLCSGEQYA